MHIDVDIFDHYSQLVGNDRELITIHKGLQYLECDGLLSFFFISCWIQSGQDKIYTTSKLSLLPVSNIGHINLHDKAEEI